MSWQQVLGHDGIADRFRTAIRGGRLAGTFLFVGPAGIGKYAFARKLAQSLLCEVNAESELLPCQTCDACQQVSADSHPDLLVVSKPDDKNFIPVESFIGDREHRMRRGLCHDISLKPYRGGRKIAVIDDADYLNQEGANCLLKTLEEPPPKSLIILISTSEQKQLPTIRSRCQVIRFQPLTREQVEQLLLRQGLVDDPQAAARAARVADGSLRRALEMTDPKIEEFRRELFAQLGRRNWDSNQLAGSVSSFVDQAGKDAPPRRARMRQIMLMACDFYRRLLLTACGLDSHEEPAPGDATVEASCAWKDDTVRLADCLDRCLNALGHIDANANQATLLECWVDDLWQLHRGSAATG